jgi:SAM-dependent methyltransferase
MSRTERRLARKRGGSVPGSQGSAETGSNSDISSLFASAAECYRSGAVAQANALGKTILARDPNHAQTLNLLGIIAQQAGRNRVAVKLISQAIAQDPNDAPFHYNIGLAFQALGSGDEALAHYERAISLGLRDETTLVNDNAFVVRCVRRIEAAWPRRLTLQELFGEDGLDAFVADNLLFRCLLQFGYAHDHVLERFLTEFRFAVLRIVASADANTVRFDDEVMRFLSALALQCFRNGYVFALSGGEMENVRALHDTLAEKLRSGADIDPILLIVIAAYAPLYLLPTADAIAAHAWPEFLRAIVAQQLAAPRAESEIRKTIQSLTSIDDDVSQRVQQQYEESPYPAWTTVPPVKAATLDRYLGEKLLRNLTHVAGVPVQEILIAGCGTGHHSINTARAFPQAHVLGVDISRASLSYAIRKTRELDVANIEYAHADILKLGSIGRTFDLIESIGVLHHLSDPAAGWDVLLSLLKPGGVIGIGLYSERARRAIVAARAFIAERGYRPVVEDIRAARQELTRRSIVVPSDSVVIFRDFFDTSGCRDLLFNVMEHRFTIAQIKAFLTENVLTFLGFELTPQIRAQFLERFPGEESLVDLDKWDLFEAAHPETFVGMYVFYARKRS